MMHAKHFDRISRFLVVITRTYSNNCLSIFHEEEEGEDFYRDCGEDGVHVDDSCPFRDEADADTTECGWRRLQEIWREGQESEQKTVISWQDAPDDLFYKAGAKTKKVSMC